MIKKPLIKHMYTIVILGALLLSACGGGKPEPTPTLSVEQIQTQVVETFSAALTQTVLAAPSDTPTPTLTASPTTQPLPTSTAGIPFGGATVPPTTSCYRLAFVSDVTIPDNTNMTPGQTFTKTWKVRNTGSCAWDAGFKFSFTGGDAMNGATYTLPSAVPANAEVDISVPMTAPTNKTGAVRGNWRMSTAAGQFFGDEVYVLIVVGGATATNTSAAATNTSAPATATTAPTSTTEPPATQQ
jgi:hypothetical protein